MSEYWAFDLSMSAVRLLRRQDGDWQEIAIQKIEGADIEKRLQDLADLIQPPVPITIFLPNDQILFTEVSIASEGNAAAEIHAAMDGRTPYSLEELQIDWELSAQGIASVAAIARDTLSEAQQFAAGRGLEVVGYSSFVDENQFPRLPLFSEPQSAAFAEIAPKSITEDETQPKVETTAPSFATTRTDQPSETATPAPKSNDPEGPVVKVDDPMPVMRIESADYPPLDPGTPLPRENATPRIRTDIGVATARARVESLTTPSPISIKKRDRAVPTPALAAVAAALSIGIAAVIWAILPTAPENSSAPQDSTSGQTEQVLQENPSGAETGSTTDDTVANATSESSILSDVSPAIPEITAEMGAAAPTVDDPIVFGVPDAALDRPVLPSLDTEILTSGPESVPTPGQLLERRPLNLVGIEESGPSSLSPNGSPLTETSDGITFAALKDDVALQGATAVIGSIADPPEYQLPQLLDAIPTFATAVSTSDLAVPDVVALEIQLASWDPSVPRQREPGVFPRSVFPDPQSGTMETPPEANQPEAIVAVAPTAEQVQTEPTPPTAAGPLPTPTELALSLTNIAPRGRPEGFGLQAEVSKFGRPIVELANIRPGQRPSSAQIEAMRARADTAPTALAVATSSNPKLRPGNIEIIVATARSAQAVARQERALAAATPDTTAAIEAALAEDTAAEEAAPVPRVATQPSAPTSVNVARQATIDDAIRLNRLNLVGVFGTSSDRRALVRLPSGRYVRVKVGDKIDGGTIARITADQLIYNKGNRSFALEMPSG